MRIVGDLTIRDVMKTVVLGARYGGTTTDDAGTRRVTFDAQTEIKRADFGLDWGGTAGRAVIGDTISVNIHLGAVEHPSP